MATPARLQTFILLVLVAFVQLLPSFVTSQEITYICNNTGVDFELRPGSQYCYRIWQVNEDFIEANKTCSRNNAALVRIDSLEENDYINRTFFAQLGSQEFWIGLNDIAEEGVFRWSDGSFPVYNGWAAGSPVGNQKNYDCVKFTADGWKVEEGYCATSELPFVCQQSACNSTDGQVCISTTQEQESVPTAVIVSSVLIPVFAIAAIAVVVIVLIVMYKCYNDYFYKYLCCCLYRASQFKVTTMQQEIQQLRHQLSQQKLSFSGQYQPGEFSRQLSKGKGVPRDPGSPQHTGLHSTWNQFPTKIAPLRTPSVVSGPPSLLGSYGAQPYQPMQHSFSSAAFLPFKARPTLPAINEKQTLSTGTPAQQLKAKPYSEVSDASESDDSDEASSTKSGPGKDKQQEE